MAFVIHKLNFRAGRAKRVMRVVYADVEPIDAPEVDLINLVQEERVIPIHRLG